MPELLLITHYSSVIPLPEGFSNEHFSLWLKLSYSLFVLFLIPVYLKPWGIKNFLWFSDVALILSVPALWLESCILARMLAVGVLLAEIYWNTEPSKNINWVYGLGKTPQDKLDSRLFLLLILLAYFFFLFVPSHLLLDWIFN
jgi:hypothetical protein